MIYVISVSIRWGQDAWGSQRNRTAPEPHSYTTSVEVHSPGAMPLSPLTTPPPLPPPLNTNIYDDVPQSPVSQCEILKYNTKEPWKTNRNFSRL